MTTAMTARDEEEQFWRIEQMIEDVVQKRLNGLKLIAEADKLRWDRKMAPWIIAASVTSGVVAAVVVAVISHLWR